MPRPMIVRRNHPALENLKFILLILIAAVALVRMVAAEPPPGKWLTDSKTAFSRAAADRKPVLMMFSASWCAPCNMMKRDVFTQESVKNSLNNYIAVYIDGDANRDLLKKYNVDFLPSFVVTSSSGKELGRFVGFNDANKFVKKLDIVANQLLRLEGMINANSQDPQLWKRRGQLYEELGNPDQIDEVARSYRKAQTLDPKNQTGVAADAQFFEAAKVSGGDADQADQRFAQYLKDYPNSPRAEDALFNRLDIAMREGKTDQAKALLKEYQTKYPTGKYVRVTDDILGLLNSPRPPEGSVQVAPRATPPPTRGTRPSPPPVERITVPQVPKL